jgi:hypothetical protein
LDSGKPEKIIKLEPHLEFGVDDGSEIANRENRAQMSLENAS